MIFVTTELAREGLKTLVYKNADKNAQEAKEFLENLGFNVEICRNFKKTDIIVKLEEIRADSDTFENLEHGSSVNAVALVWIGFKLDNFLKHHD